MVLPVRVAWRGFKAQPLHVEARAGALNASLHLPIRVEPGIAVEQVGAVSVEVLAGANGTYREVPGNATVRGPATIMVVGPAQVAVKGNLTVRREVEWAGNVPRVTYVVVGAWGRVVVREPGPFRLDVRVVGRVIPLVPMRLVLDGRVVEGEPRNSTYMFRVWARVEWAGQAYTALMEDLTATFHAAERLPPSRHGFEAYIRVPDRPAARVVAVINGTPYELGPGAWWGRVEELDVWGPAIAIVERRDMFASPGWDPDEDAVYWTGTGMCLSSLRNITAWCLGEEHAGLPTWKAEDAKPYGDWRVVPVEEWYRVEVHVPAMYAPGHVPNDTYVYVPNLEITRMYDPERRYVVDLPYLAPILNTTTADWSTRVAWVNGTYTHRFKTENGTLTWTVRLGEERWALFLQKWPYTRPSLAWFSVEVLSDPTRQTEWRKYNTFIANCTWRYVGPMSVARHETGEVYAAGLEDDSPAGWVYRWLCDLDLLPVIREVTERYVGPVSLENWDAVRFQPDWFAAVMLNRSILWWRGPDGRLYPTIPTLEYFNYTTEEVLRIAEGFNITVDWERRVVYGSRIGAMVIEGEWWGVPIRTLLPVVGRGYEYGYKGKVIGGWIGPPLTVIYLAPITSVGYTGIWRVAAVLVATNNTYRFFGGLIDPWNATGSPETYPIGGHIPTEGPWPYDPHIRAEKFHVKWVLAYDYNPLKDILAKLPAP